MKSAGKTRIRSKTDLTDEEKDDILYWFEKLSDYIKEDNIRLDDALECCETLCDLLYRAAENHGLR